MFLDGVLRDLRRFEALICQVLMSAHLAKKLGLFTVYIFIFMCALAIFFE